MSPAHPPPSHTPMYAGTTLHVCDNIFVFDQENTLFPPFQTRSFASIYDLILSVTVSEMLVPQILRRHPEPFIFKGPLPSTARDFPYLYAKHEKET